MSESKGIRRLEKLRRCNLGALALALARFRRWWGSDDEMAFLPSAGFRGRFLKSFGSSSFRRIDILQGLTCA